MTDISQLLNTLNTSPSVELLRLRNRTMVVEFLVNTFLSKQGAISFENMHTQLADFLEGHEIENDEESEISVFDTYEVKAKKYIQKWTNSGFLTNYPDEQGEVFYDLSSHSSKTIDWLANLKKEEFVGTESKFNNILNQLKELVEFTNEDAEKRIQLLEEKKLEIEQQIQRIKIGEDVKVFEEFEIIPRFNQLNQSAKELLSDFKEVEDNFKEITKGIYQKHAEGSLTKSDILSFTFDALDELKDSQQGKSFYAFWSFILNPDLQNKWESLTKELYDTLEEKSIPVNDSFLKGMKNHLYNSGRKVYKANDKMAEKLSRIIRETESTKSEATKKLIQQIKKQLVEISKTKKKPNVSFELETEIEINIPFERKLTTEQTEEITYTNKPKIADEDITTSNHLGKLFSQSNIDKELLRKRIKDVLKEKSQTTLLDVVENYGGLEKGLPELFGYIGIVKEFKHVINPEKTQNIIFDVERGKHIKIPEIILTK
jgi:tRNA/tmRNA/rRNA uracil-C5-methylase (TrmA/RlmC/RlmD family)